jgi:hypothetical protein
VAECAGLENRWARKGPVSSNLTSSAMNDRRPPSLLEIVGLPVAGAVAIEVFHSRTNELILFAVPFLVAAVRVFVAQFQVPPMGGDDANHRTSQARSACVAINQISVLVLIFVECGVVMATSPSVPAEVWAIIAGIFSLYILLRLISRRCWIAAAAL